jgi:pimeloyl-ACP methyl ester carboxylesterase
MKRLWATFPWFISGCAATAVSVPAAARLTPFREALVREGALRDVEVDGRRYCVAEMGRGPTLVLLHGLGGSIYDWRHLLHPLAEDHRVIAIDLLGAGESEIPETEDFSIAAQARRVKGLLDVLGAERASLVGNSYGGGIALRFAQDWPERVEKLVLINSICYADEIPTYVSLCKVPGAEYVAGALPLGKMTRWVLRGSYRTVARLSDEELDTYIQEIRAPGRRAAIVRIIRAVVPDDTTEFEARLKAIRAPSLLLWGTADETVPLKLGRRLATDLPNSRLVELDAGHVPNQERPEEVLRLLREFIQ